MSAAVAIGSGLFKLGKAVVVGEQQKNESIALLTTIRNSQEDDVYMKSLGAPKTSVFGVKTGSFSPVIVVAGVIVGAVIVGKVVRKRKRK